MAVTTNRKAPSTIFKTKTAPAHGKFSHLLESNNPPSYEEARLIRDVVQQMNAEVQILKTRAEREFWPWTRATLNSRIEKLNRQIERHTSVLSIIRVIPIELIQHIFLLSDTNPWTLSHICNIWRQYAHASPALWTSLPEVFMQRTTPKETAFTLEMLAARMRYTSNAPLDIRISTPYSYPVDVEYMRQLSESPVLALLVSHSDRWRTAHLRLPQVVVASLTPAVTGHLARLRTLSLDFSFTYSDDPQQDFAEIHAFADTPQLRVLHIKGGFSGEVVLAHPNLSHLARGWPSTRGVASLAQFTSLVSLHITCQYGTPAPQAQAQGTSASPLTLPLTLPFLQTLSGDLDLVPNGTCALLNSLIIPSITDIALRFPGEGSLQELTNMLMRSGQRATPTVRRFRLRNERQLLQSGDVVVLLRVMTELERLEISLPHVDDINALAKTKYDSLTPGEVLVPRLERCVFLFEEAHTRRRVSARPNERLRNAIRSVALNRCETPSQRAGGGVDTETDTNAMLEMGVRPLRLFELGGRSFFYTVSGSRVYHLRLNEAQCNHLYTQADFESWAESTSTSTSTQRIEPGSGLQQLIRLHDALVDQIPLLYRGIIAMPGGAVDSAWRRRVGAILDEVEVVDANGLGTFDVLMGNMHIAMEKLTTRNTERYRTLVRGGLSFPQADRLVARWSAFIAPHLSDIHWAYARTGSYPNYDNLAGQPSLVYVRSDHPIRASNNVDDEGMKAVTMSHDTSVDSEQLLLLAGPAYIPSLDQYHIPVTSVHWIHRTLLKKAMECSEKKRSIADFFKLKVPTLNTHTVPERGVQLVLAEAASRNSVSREDAPAPAKKLKITASNGHHALARLGTARPRAAKRVKTEMVGETLNFTNKAAGGISGRLKKKGELSFLPSLPLDILYEIFKLLMPTDILYLSRTTKALRAVLLHRSATTVWMASLKHINDFPTCPDDISLPAWTSLLLETYCENCLSKNSSVDFILRIRCCTHCSCSLLVPLFRYPKMYSILEKAVTSTHWNGHKQLLAVKKEVNAFMAKWKTRTKLGDQLIEERAAVAKRKVIGKQAKKWYDERAAARADKVEDLKYERAAAIQAKLTEAGYASELSFFLRFKSGCVIDPLPNDVPDFYHHYHVNQSRPLTERIWKNMEPDMVKFMLRIRGHMNENDRCVVIRERRKVIHQLYLGWRNGKAILEQYPADYFMPGPVDIIEHYRFSDTLHMPSAVKIDAWTEVIHTELQKHLPEIIPTWREDGTNYFLEELKYEPSVVDTLEWSFEWSPMRRRHEQLQLATVVFRCTDDMMHWPVDGLRARDQGCAAFDRECGMWVRDGSEPAPLLWYPAFLTHPCASTQTHEPCDGRPAPEANFSLNAMYQYRDRTWGTGLYQKRWSYEHLEFDELASKTTLNILEACGMTNTTTVEEVDARDPRVVCLRCSFGTRCNGEHPMRVMGWREAVNHSVKTHFGNSIVKWECLSPVDTAEAKRLEAIEAAKENYPTPTTQRVWRCTACRHHTHDPGRMTWAGLKAHFRQNPTHGNVDDMDAELNRRYFKDPEMTRRALPRIKMIPGDGKASPPTMPQSGL